MKNIKTLVKNIKLGSMLLIAVSISGCSTYNSNFGCPDARGLNCMPVSLVNAQIDSGQIESVSKQKKRCKGGKCYTQNQDDMKPELKLENLR
ncbi:hypothetical protein N7281_07930 [Rickettsia hoogstraalii]|uniref:hypothetical protein n=1 Tax=Rickettsia hoogstraalii TaxID=467174 RepID=UPI0022517ABE|nr:hypothetical protein [Rickettsia hoogstraalii]MCX4084726.1 hypothetical protein [Rickettsia hoogstraalii]